MRKTDRQEFVDKWSLDIGHIDRWVRSHIVEDMSGYESDRKRAWAMITVRDGKKWWGGAGDAICRFDDTPNKHVGLELAHDRAVQDVVVQVLLERIAQEAYRKEAREQYENEQYEKMASKKPATESVDG